MNYRAKILVPVLAGITTSLVMVPEVVAFAILAHVAPMVGLYAAIIMGLVTSIFGGRPGLISGGAGSMAVVSVALVVTYGIQYLFACLLLTGCLQILFGVFKFGKVIKYVNSTVMQGFVNGLALVIFVAQFQQFEINGEIMKGQQLTTMIGLTILTILCAWASTKITKKIPSSLVAIVSVTTLVSVFGLDTQTVGDIVKISGSLPTLALPDVPISVHTLGIIAPYSFVLAAIGLIETLLTANLVDSFVHKHKPHHHTHPNKESVAQGVGNFLNGLFGGMGGCAMIGQTVVNLEAGGFSRWSGVICSISILSYVLFAGFIIDMIPLASLVGVMCVVCYHTFDWSSFNINNRTKSDLVLMSLVMAITVVYNLASAVIIGVFLSSLVNYVKIKD